MRQLQTDVRKPNDHFEMKNKNRLNYLRVGYLLLLVVQSCCVVTSPYKPLPSDEQLIDLDPRGVVNLFWKSALDGEVEALKKTIGHAGKSMLRDCSQDEVTRDRFGDSIQPHDMPERPNLDEPGDNMEAILNHANVIRIARKRLETDYEFVEEKLFGNEARLTYRRKESPNAFNSEVFFLIFEQRWRIVDIRPEAHLQFVGNKKFGELRNCSE